MDIISIKAFSAPNVHSLNKSIVKMQLSLGELAEVPTREIKDFNRSIKKLFPGLVQHKCCRGHIGGFLERLEEGTYLAHVTEHLCLEIQKMLGYDVVHGKARQVKDEIYDVIYQYRNKVLGEACGPMIVNTLNRLIRGEDPDFETGLDYLRKLAFRYDRGVSTGAIMDEAERRGIPVSEVDDSSLLRLGYGKYQKMIHATLNEQTRAIAVDIACDKSLTKAVLNEVSLPVPEGRICLTWEEAKKSAAELGYPLVVKPKSGNQGKGVTLNIQEETELKQAFDQVLATGDEVLLERFIPGKDYRLLVVNGKMVAASHCMPAQVVGDGTHTVQQLIDLENRSGLRGEDHEKPLTRIKIDDNIENTLNKQGMGLSDIPPANQTVWLRGNANLSTGGTASDCTGRVHPENRKAAEKAALAIGLDIAGIDMVVPDISEPMREGSGAIVEVNAAPGIRMHLNPSQGEKRDVASLILDMIFPPDTPHSIPVIAITGTNGKTTTTRMISHILRKSGLNVGTTTTHGIFFNEDCIEEGDTTGPQSARRILNHREVEAAVLETARGGIVRDGLAYRRADVAVFTNLTGDHLGIDGIHTMEDLLHVKSLVVETVKETGTSVLNADDPWVMKALSKARGTVCLYTLRHDHPSLPEHFRHGGSAVYLHGPNIYFRYVNTIEKVSSVREIPATLDETLEHNIYNSLAAIAAGLALDIPIHTIREALHEFHCDVRTNPGRFNIYNMGNFKVVL